MDLKVVSVAGILVGDCWTIVGVWEGLKNKEVTRRVEKYIEREYHLIKDVTTMLIMLRLQLL